MLICIFGKVWESPSGSDSGLSAVPCALGRKERQSLPQCPSQALWRQFGPEVPGADCKPCLEQTKPRADCLWISALLPTQMYAGGEKQAASLQVLMQPLALLPLNYESQDLKGDLCCPLRRTALLQVQKRLHCAKGCWVLSS